MEQLQEKVVVVTGDEHTIAESNIWMAGRHDAKGSGVKIVEIVDAAGKSWMPVFQKEWTEVSSRIFTREALRHPGYAHEVRFKTTACPILIKFREWYKYEPDFGNTELSERYFWRKYVAG